MKPYVTRYLKITVKTAVSVYLPRDSGADRAASDAALLEQTQKHVDWWSDGRKRFPVEQLQTAAETIVRDAIKRLVETHFRASGLQAAIEAGVTTSERAHNKLEDDVALAMAHVSVAATDVNDEHALEIEIS